MMRKGYFVSDLHLFSQRSQAHRHLEAISHAASRAHLFVLGGDIFDFRWSTLGSIDATVAAAIDWLDQLTGPHPECEFHFVLGNHDFNRRFTQRLDAFARTRPNLAWHPYYLRRGRSLFLHGDVANRRMTHSALVQARQHCLDDELRSRAAHRMYDILVQSQLHRVAGAVANRPRSVARKVWSYLEDIGHTAASGVEHVYFGHTHVPMSDYRFRGMAFHNGGATIKGLSFRIVETQCREGELVAA